MKSEHKRLLLTMGVVAIVAYSVGHAKGVREMAVKLSAVTSTELAVYLAAQDYFASKH